MSCTRNRSPAGERELRRPFSRRRGFAATRRSSLCCWRPTRTETPQVQTTASNRSLAVNEAEAQCP
eukprot:4166274-Alexandrium_andersonii.AAC.1